MDPVTILASVSAALNIVDKVYRPIQWILSKRPGEKPDERPYKVQAEKSGDSVVFKEQNRTIEVITAAELDRLPEADKKLINTYAQAMERNFDLWSKVYPKLGMSADEIVNAKLELQLKDISREMCKDLRNILNYLDRLGKNLQDHYDHIRQVCAELGGGC